jgi:hypothetical protein
MLGNHNFLPIQPSILWMINEWVNNKSNPERATGRMRGKNWCVSQLGSKPGDSEYPPERFKRTTFDFEREIFQPDFCCDGLE